MSDELINDEVATTLCAKLKACDLTQAERTLLDQIVTVARDVTDPAAVFDEEFDHCFKPGEAQKIMAYHPTWQGRSITKHLAGGGSFTIPID